ncbi:MAG: glycosyltransferase family 4 protein [Firmicutes bacterium]|nr:glycosyltransferase family 4 protein [Bacillota bacterium]
MRIALVAPRTESGEERQAFFRLAGELAGAGAECLLFAGGGDEKGTEKYAAFHAVLARQLVPVTVFLRKETDKLRIFFVSSRQSVPYAAAVAATIGKLAAAGCRPDLLHLFSAADAVTALLCRQYLRLPYIYSIRRLRETKQSRADFAGLGIQLPPGCPAAGEYLYTEQLAAACARYLVDETGDVRWWKEFFCSFSGQYVAGKPYADTRFWSEQASLGEARRRKKAELLGTENGVVVAAAGRSELPPRTEGVVCLPEPASLAERRELFATADFYLMTHECKDMQRLAQAMAAGCLPLVPAGGAAECLLLAGGGEGEQFWLSFRQEDWPEVLAMAAARLHLGPRQMLAARQKAQNYACRHFSYTAAAALYLSIYRESAPVRLPFVTEDPGPPVAAVPGEILS